MFCFPFGLHRAQLLLDDSIESARLRLSEVRAADEGEYKCEITFLDITKDCPVVQLVKLTTMGEEERRISSMDKYSLRGHATRPGWKWRLSMWKKTQLETANFFVNTSNSVKS